jgi:sulfur carrier protein ThiS
VQIKVFVGDREIQLLLNSGAKVSDILNALELEENEHIVLRNSALIPLDEELGDRDSIEVVRVVTGG